MEGCFFALNFAAHRQGKKGVLGWEMVGSSEKTPWTSVQLSFFEPRAEKTGDVEGLRHFFFQILFRSFLVKEKTPTLPETNSSPRQSPFFLVNTNKMVDFPWLC